MIVLQPVMVKNLLRNYELKISFEKQTSEIFVVFFVFFVVVVRIFLFCFVFFRVSLQKTKELFLQRNISEYLEKYIIYCKVYAHG